MSGKVIVFQSQREKMPPLSISPQQFKLIAMKLLHRENQRKNWEYSEGSQARAWASFFGTSPQVAAMIWNKMVTNVVIPNGGQPKHLLFGYVLLKRYSGDDAHEKIVGCSVNTFRKWAWKFIQLIHDLHHEVIRIENRFVN